MRFAVSLVVLTHNRTRATLLKALRHSIDNAECPIHEIVHVDNGSPKEFTDWFKEEFDPSTQVLNRKNMGVAIGYNRGLALTVGSHVAIIGCDRRMPQGWLRLWREHFEAIPNTGVISMYTKESPERLRGSPQLVNGVEIQPAMVFEARIHSKEFLFAAGYFREDFGYYSHEDCEYVDRCTRVAEERRLLNYIIPGLYAEHVTPENENPYTCPTGETFASYREWKESHAAFPWKYEMVKDFWKIGNPHYNPFARTEVHHQERGLYAGYNP